MSAITNLLFANLTQGLQQSAPWPLPSPTSPLGELLTELVNATTVNNNHHNIPLPFQSLPNSPYGSSAGQSTGGGSQALGPYGQNRGYPNNWNSQFPFPGGGGPNWASGSSGEENWNSWNRVFKLVLLSFVSTVGSMGAIFVISAITVIDTFQVRGNCFLVSLAFGHLIVTLAVLPASAIAIMANITENAELCHFQWLLTLACFIVTLLSFACLALDNYFGLNAMVRYQLCCTKCRVLLLLILIWVAAVALPWAQHHYDWGPEFCPDRRNLKITLEVHPYVLGGIVLTTLLTMACFMRTLFKYKQYKLALENSSSDTSFILHDGYLLRCNSFVYFVSLCMWLPMIVLMVIDPFKHLPQHYLDTVWYIALGNSCCFSYLYAATNRDFREAFNKLFYYCCCKSHVTFTRKGAAMRRTLANESLGLRVHIIPGLNIYAQRKETGYGANYGAGSSSGDWPLLHSTMHLNHLSHAHLHYHQQHIRRIVVDRRHHRVEPMATGHHHNHHHHLQQQASLRKAD